MSTDALPPADTGADAAPTEAAAAPEAPAAAEMSTNACARELAQRFPALFGGQPKPIKLRIQADIQARAPGVFGRKVLSVVLHRHTMQTAYLLALTRTNQRFDLDGQPAGEVAEEHRQAAAEELKRRRGVVEARRQAEDDARRQRFGLVRDFERTTLTRANFCALKGVAEDQLDGLLATIRQEIAEWEASHPPRPRPEGRSGAPRRDAPRRHDGPREGPRGGGERRGPRPPRQG